MVPSPSEPENGLGVIGEKILISKRSLMLGTILL